MVKLICEEEIELNHIGYDDEENFKYTTKVMLRAIEDNNKIVVLRKDIGDIEENNRDEYIFCDYLKFDEISTFFDSIDIDEYIILNSDSGLHCPYGMNPKIQDIQVQFTINENINGIKRNITFCDGTWFSSIDDEELVGDVSENNRDKFIQEFKSKLEGN